jgi:2,4-dienoyl-CoA reductase-like NADH-dependent reductase (Old Yellow Enzyme family)
MQINHPGRQTYKNMGGKVLSPSDVALDLGKHSSLFSQPKAMDKCDIEDVILRFTNTATLAEKAGFDGVQVHGAHGYLLSQFLSPLVNKRDDEWGGDLTNRSRLLLEIVKSIKAATSSSFSVSVKLNSADFQRGGFDVDDAKSVVTSLEKLQIDFVELSGGSYEAPAMQGRTADSRTLAREAYFLEFADAIAKQTELTVMTTGGIKKRDVAEKVLQSSVDIVGIASAMAYQPDLPNQWQQNQCNEGFIPQVNWKNKTFAALATMALVRRQLQRMGKNKKPSKGHSALFSLIKDQVRLARLTKRYRRFVLGEQS